jgi:hypothetical protein
MGPLTPSWGTPLRRYQAFQGAARAKARVAALRAGDRLSALASSWAAFAVRSAQLVKTEGRLGLVLPAELLSTNYAGPVRRFLCERFGSVRLIMFDDEYSLADSPRSCCSQGVGLGRCQAEVPIVAVTIPRSFAPAIELGEDVAPHQLRVRLRHLGRKASRGPFRLGIGWPPMGDGWGGERV